MDSVTGDGRPALHLASQYGHDHIMTWLLENTYIDIKIQDGRGNTALHNSALSGHSSCVDILLRAGLDVDCQSNNGLTALHDACQSGDMDTVTTIMQYKPTLLFANNGESALNEASLNNHYKVLDTLVRNNGWDVDTVNIHLTLNTEHSY